MQSIFVAYILMVKGLEGYKQCSYFIKQLPPKFYFLCSFIRKLFDF